MGDFEAGALAFVESPVKYHPYCTMVLTSYRGTVPVGQFNWGGSLLKGNGGAQRYPQSVWKSDVECKGIRMLDCEADKLSRTETWA